MLKVFCDGGARGNPGPAASAFVVYKDGDMIYSASKYLGKATNNIAEYEALIMALKYFFDKGVKEDIIFILDSQLITKQMQGVYRVKNENLKKYFLIAKELEEKLGNKIDYRWSERANNKVADSLVNKQLDAHLL